MHVGNLDKIHARGKTESSHAKLKLDKQPPKTHVRLTATNMHVKQKADTHNDSKLTHEITHLNILSETF